MAEAEIYLFTGPEAGEKNDAIQTIREASRKKNGDLDEYKYYAQDIRIEDLVAQLQNTGLFTSATFIVLRNAELIKTKSEIDLLASYAKGAVNSPNTLILVSDENSIDKKLDGIIPSSHKKMFWEMFENRKNAWVSGFFKKNGFSVTDEAVEQILDMVENNTDTLKSECSRFFYCFPKDHKITEKDVDQILSHNREENAFTLFEAMAENGKSPKQRYETSIEILQKIRTSKESNAQALIAGLTYCFRQLRTWQGINPKDGPAPTDAALKAAGFSGKKNQERYRNAAKVWSGGAVTSIISLLSKTDMELRQNRSFAEETRLTLLITSIVLKNGLYPTDFQEDL